MLSWEIVAPMLIPTAPQKQGVQSMGVMALLSIINHSVLINSLLLPRLERGMRSVDMRSSVVASVISAPMERSRSTAREALNQLSLRPHSLLNSFWVFTIPSALVLSNSVWNLSLFLMHLFMQDRAEIGSKTKINLRSD